MKLTYDPDADILYLALREAPLATSTDLEPGITAEYDTDGQLAGLEILDAFDRIEILAGDDQTVAGLSPALDLNDLAQMAAGIEAADASLAAVAAIVDGFRDAVAAVQAQIAEGHRASQLLMAIELMNSQRDQTEALSRARESSEPVMTLAGAPQRRKNRHAS